ncbi:MAG: CBS domain-containing protein [Massilia sp.]
MAGPRKFCSEYKIAPMRGERRHFAGGASRDETLRALPVQIATHYRRFLPEEHAMQAISEVMTRDVSVVPPDADLQRVAQMMRDLNVGAVPVCDGKRLLGMITDRDITIRAVAEGIAPATSRVADVMSKDVSWCFDDQSVGEVLQQMGDQQIRRLPVVSRHSMELAGVVSLGDLATRQEGPIDSTLEDISRAAPPQRPSTGKQPSQH